MSRTAPARDEAAPDRLRWMGIFEAELDYVYWTLRRFGATAGDAEDLCQEVFLTMWRRRSTYDPSRPVRPWIAGIAFRVKQQHRRRGARETPRGFVDLADHAPLADERLEAERTQSLVLAALARLPERQRTVLVLHDIDGLPMRDIAEVLSVPLFTLYSRLRTGRRAFAKEVRRADRLVDPGAAPRLLARERHPSAAPANTRRRLTSRLRAVVEDLPPMPRPPATLATVASAAAAVAALGLLMLSHPQALHRRAVAAPTRRAPQAPGLVAYWGFDEGRGSMVARDGSGRGNDCRLVRLDPDLARIPGRIGNALALDGRGWLECPGTSALAGLRDEITISAWVTRGHVLRNYHAVVARQKDAGRLDEFMFGFSNGELLFSSHVWRGKVTQPLPETAGPWLHVAASRHRDGTTVLFADGREIGRGHTGPGLLDPGGNPLILGGARNDPTSRTQARFDGQIDEVRIYDRALAPAEIAALAAAPGK